MQRFFIALAVATISASAAAADTAVSVSIGQPGYYGRIDIGNAYPQPQVIYAQPRVILRGAPLHQPIYLRVPPGHRQNWKKHCRHYNACSERVYFVQDSWYERDYVPRYQQHQRDRNDGRNQPGGNDDRDDPRGKNGNARGNAHR